MLLFLDWLFSGTHVLVILCEVAIDIQCKSINLLGMM